MEQIRKFLRDKGFALALLACLVAAAAAGVWAVRTVRDELDKNLSGLKTPDSTSTAPASMRGFPPPRHRRTKQHGNGRPNPPQTV